MYVGLRIIAAGIANRIVANPEHDMKTESLPASSDSGFALL